MRRTKLKEDIGKHFGVNPRTVLNWAKEGCPSSRKKIVGSPYMFSISEVDKWLEKQGRTAQPGRPLGGGVVSREQRTAQLSLTVERALMKQLQRKELEGLLHRVSDCKERRLKQIYSVKHELYALVRHLPEELVNRSKEIIKGKLTEQIERICKQFAGDIEIEAKEKTG